MITLGGQVIISNLPPHFGLIISLAFFGVAEPESDPPFDGDPPGEAATDCPQLYHSVDLKKTESQETSRVVPFTIEHEPGHFYLQLRTILFRKHKGKLYAQAEQFFFGRRPLTLQEDLLSITLPVEWPSIPVEDLGIYGKMEPRKQ